jgi:biopolymer transport protein ExbD
LNKQIEIVVDAKGSSTIETKGFTGSECIEASRFVEQALGQKAKEQTTAEFYINASTKVQQDQRVN